MKYFEVSSVLVEFFFEIEIVFIIMTLSGMPSRQINLIVLHSSFLMEYILRHGQFLVGMLYSYHDSLRESLQDKSD